MSKQPLKKFLVYALFPLILNTVSSATPVCATNKPSGLVLNDADNSAIRAQLDAVGKFAAAGNAASLSGLFTVNGVYTDIEGNLYEGQEALKKRFESVQDNTSKPGSRVVVLKPDQIRLLSKSIATTEGIVYRQNAEGKSVPDTRYSFVMMKESGKWLIASASETALEVFDNATPPEPSLKDLTWLIGDWKAEKNGKTLNMHVDWAGNKNFIRCAFQISTPGQPVQDDTEMIAFDPRNHQLVSWSFDSTGAFGGSTWTTDGQEWKQDSVKTGPDGASLTSCIIIKPSENAFTWQSINRTAAGLPLPDTEELKVERAHG